MIASRRQRPVPFYPPVQSDSLDHEFVDRLLSDEMKRLSLAERERVTDDVHGVARLVEETPELLERCLADMAAHVRDLQLESSGAECEAYQTALGLDPTYATSDNFLLKFIRAADYDPLEAAQRMLIHFTHKLELFGEDKLNREIGCDDLDEEERKTLSCGYMEMLLSPDRSGRYVSLERTEYGPKAMPWRKKARTMWFATMLGAQHVHVQRQGVVGILFFNNREIFDDDMLRQLASFQYAIPMKIAGLHVCFENPDMARHVSKIGYYCERSRRLRIRMHSGSFMENQLALRSFGIPVAETRPGISSEEQMLRRFHYWHFMQIQAEIARRKKDLLSLGPQRKQSIGSNSSQSSVSIEVMDETARHQTNYEPQPADVLCGRGDSRNHVGNVRMHQLVKDHVLSYQHRGKAGKTDLVKYVVQCIRDEGGRFLKHPTVIGESGEVSTTNAWVELEENLVHEKVSKVFRRHLKKLR